MRKHILITAITILIISCSSTANTAKSKTQVSKEESKHLVAQSTDRNISDSTFMIEILHGGESSYSMTLGLPRLTMSGNYFLKVDKDKLDVYLPYSGKRTGAILNGGGIEVDTSDFEISTKQSRRGDGWDIEIKTDDSEGGSPERFVFSIKVSKSGHVSMGLRSNSRESVSYTGKLCELSSDK